MEAKTGELNGILMGSTILFLLRCLRCSIPIISSKIQYYFYLVSWPSGGISEFSI